MGIEQTGQDLLTTKFGAGFKTKVLASLVRDVEFIEHVQELVNPDHFKNKHERWVVELTLQYYQKYGNLPSSDVFATELTRLKTADPHTYEGTVTLCRNLFTTTLSDSSYFRDEYFRFAKHQAIRDAFEQSVDFFKHEMYDDIVRVIDRAKNLGGGLTLPVRQEDNIAARYDQSETKVIPLPFEYMNERMTLGGLAPGELCCVLGPPGGGKTWWVINWVNRLRMAGYDVLHFNLESSARAVLNRYDANLIEVDSSLCYGQIDLIEQTVNALPGKLRLVDVQGDNRTLAYLRQYTKFLRKNEPDFKPVLIVIDYIGRLKRGGKHTNEYMNQSDLVKEVIDFAKELGVAIVSPFPVGRIGAGVPVITEEHIAGTFDTVYDADLILSISLHRVMHWIKNKNGKGKGVDQYDIDMSTGKFYYVGPYEPPQKETRRIYT